MNKEKLFEVICEGISSYMFVHTDQGDFRVLGAYIDDRDNYRIFTSSEEEGKHNDFPVELVKPYLRRISSMTKKELEEFDKLRCHLEGLGVIDTMESFGWLVRNHFDHFGLIDTGEALEAPSSMYTHFGNMDITITVNG